MVESATTFALTLSSIIVFAVEFWRFFRYPTDELLNLFVFKESFDSVVIVLEVTLRKRRVNLLMANTVDANGFFASKRLR